MVALAAESGCSMQKMMGHVPFIVFLCGDFFLRN